MQADPRLAIVTQPDGRYDMFRIGELEHARRTGQALSDEEQVAYDTILHEDPRATAILSNAARLWVEHLERQVREYGGTILRETVRWENGRRSRECRLERFPAKAHTPTRTRARGAGRPAGKRTSSRASRGGDSGDSDPHEAEPGPESGLDHKGLDAWLADRRRALEAVIAGWRA